MRKLGALTAVVALVGAVSADAANVTFGIRQTTTNLTTINVLNGQVVSFEVTAEIDDDSTSTDGLALVGTDLTFGVGTIAQLNGGALANPGGVMTAFNYPNGVTNPPFPPGSYGGTNNGTALLQVGGGQNTIGNPGPTPPFPVGSVNLQVGAGAGSSPQVIATGNYTVPGSGSGPFTITLANCFANTIDNGETGPVYNVSAATATCVAVLTMNAGVGPTVQTAVARKNCDLNIDMVAGAPITSEPRQGGGGRGISRVVFTYTAPPTNTAITINEDASCPSPPTYVAYTGTSVANCSAVASTLDCTFTPALENTRTYRFTVASGASTANVELRGLVGDVNSDGNVNAGDRSIVVAAWTGPGFTCVSDLDNSGSTNAGDRSIVVAAWTGGPATNCAP